MTITTTNTGAASLSMNFKEFRAALCRFNDSDKPVSIADRVMILSNAMFLLDQYERVTATPQADERERFYAQGLRDGIRIGESRSTPQADAAPSFDEWAMKEGLISESHGVRFVNSMCDVARKAWDAAIAAGGAQEPVGWAIKYVNSDILEFNFETGDEPSEEDRAFAKGHGQEYVPLYAAQIPREAATGDREFHEAAVKLVRDMMNLIPSFSAPSDILARINALVTAPVPRVAETVALKDEAIVDALKSAKQFIANGVALGYIRMPDADCPDPAHDTPKKIDTALALLAAAANGEQS